MTSSCDSARRRRGYSVLEVLVVLAVLALVLGAAASRFTPPSDRLELEHLGSATIAAATTSRLRALRTGAIVPLEIETDGRVSPCAKADEGARPQILFFPDGHAEGGPLCFAMGARRLTFSVDWLTGVAETVIE